MKVEEKEKFTGFRLIIDVENLDDLHALWHRFNAGSVRIKELADSYPISYNRTVDELNALEIFKVLDKHVGYVEGKLNENS